MTSIKDICTTFARHGICEVDIDKVVSAWDCNWAIAQWHEDYSIMVIDGDNYNKAKISKQQAHELIGLLDLVDEKSKTFTNARTWRKNEV